jgi:hypothetical protein
VFVFSHRCPKKSQAREAELQRTMLAMSTLTRMRGRIVEASLNRRMKAYIQEREKHDAVEWGKIEVNPYGPQARLSSV